MAVMMASSPTFTVRRRDAVLITPSSPTPNELKPLSDIDDQQSLRFHVSFIHYYRAQPSSCTDPAKVIRGALADALVFYYPLAGRLREGPDNNKLLVDCTAEGVPFIESDADVRLNDFGEALTAPVPCLDELLPGTVGITGCPLLLFQVTRLLCGGFILALRVNHTIADGPGLLQFLSAVAEIARGADAPSVLPVWERHLLSARVPPRITHSHPEFDVLPAVTMASVRADMVDRSFFFTQSEVSALKRYYSPRICSTFDVLAASLWRSRTAALGIEPDDEVRLYFNINARGRLESMVPAGYYGNAFVYPAVISTAGELCGRSLGYAIELIRKAKDSVTADFMRSVVDLMVLRGRPPFAMADMEHTCFISENTRTGFHELDFGWGKPVFGGTAEGGFQAVPGVLSFFVRFRDRNGEEGVVVPVCLPEDAMQRFVVGIEGLIGRNIRELHKHA